MKLSVEFGFPGIKKQVNWWSDLETFPHFINYRGRKYEWVAYDKDLTETVDFNLIFSESINPPTISLFVDWEKTFEDNIHCECGSEACGSDKHSSWCPKF